MAVADARRQPAGGGVERRPVVEEREHPVLTRDVDDLPAPRRVARHDRGEDADRAEEPLHVVAERAPAARRRIVGEPGERHEATRRLGDDVVGGPPAPRPRLPEAGETPHDQAGLVGAERRRIEPPPRERAAREVLDQHVEVRQQATQERPPLLVAEVERDAALVAVEREEEDRHAAGRRVAVPALVTPAGRLHLHDVGAHVRQDRGTERAGEKAREVEDADAGERAHR